jgi:putative two-component system response regulator
MGVPGNGPRKEADWVVKLEADTVLGADAQCRLKTHQNAVGDIAEVIARHMGVSKGMSEAIGTAAAYHDVGKLKMPVEILCKPGQLTEQEFAVMREHSALGHDMLIQYVGRLAQLAANIALHHHESMDGTGYPNGLSGESIPIEARIVGIADVYDALREDRPYRDGMTHEKAMAIILEGDERTSRDKFCPKVKRIVEQHDVEIAQHWRHYH